MADIIINERKIIFSKFENDLDNLSLLNKRLIEFSKEPQTSITKAKNDLKKHPEKKISLNMAKEYVNISCFLQKL